METKTQCRSPALKKVEPCSFQKNTHVKSFHTVKHIFLSNVFTSGGNFSPFYTYKSYSTPQTCPQGQILMPGNPKLDWKNVNITKNGEKHVNETKKTNIRNNNWNLSYQGTLVGPSMFLSVCSDYDNVRSFQHMKIRQVASRNYCFVPKLLRLELAHPSMLHSRHECEPLLIRLWQIRIAISCSRTAAHAVLLSWFNLGGS